MPYNTNGWRPFYIGLSNWFVQPSNRLTSNPPEILNVWHDFRYPALSVAVLCLFATYLYARVRAGRQRLSSSPIAGTPDGGLVGVEKAEWLEEKNLVGAAQGKHAPRSETTSETILGLGNLERATVRPRLSPKRVKGSKTGKYNVAEKPTVGKIQPMIFYFSLTENTTTHASSFQRELLKDVEDECANVLRPLIYDLAVIDHEDFFEHLPAPEGSAEKIDYFYTLIVPSYNIDTALDNFLALLQETHNDFRIDTAPLQNVAGYSVFGFGDREGWPTEEEGFCSQAIEVDRWMAKLTARKRAYPLGLGDVNSDALENFKAWREGLTRVLFDISIHGLGEGVVGSGDPVESDGEDVAESDQTFTSNPRAPTKRKRSQQKSRVDDLEDLGGKALSQIDEASTANPSPSPLPIDFTTSSSRTLPAAPPLLKAMVPASSPTYAALTKQGYTIVGTHSGVKICRWTKSALRGRGSCYKYSFYGIKSHLCMETTPSLSCSNKCVFCWRHGTNPVGTTWRWQVDPPDMIFNGAKEGHYKKIKMMRGVPGVRAERFQEAMQIRHCALSLVGEPIFYPHINAFVALLHAERISSFLVCNAQHPDQLAALNPVTQLYVSIDASNADSLRKIDRPLHRDYWQRFLRCLDILKAKRFRMRTVYRLTLVKGFNIDSEIEGYADLVARGLPCFVEIKGVTYCGTSSSAGAGLTMQNVPFYDEIVAFVEGLNAALHRRGLGYGIAAEHRHSCCVLLASDRFLVQGRWHTLIDYEAFFACLERGGDFSPEDYMGAETPEWATWGKGGFDPNDQRVYRKGKGPAAVDGAAAHADVDATGGGVATATKLIEI